ncbi:MAG: site-specific integrase [Chloroflexi bacterium]|nr:site-specific integrase [Chloroflexota bacterium]
MQEKLKIALRDQQQGMLIATPQQTTQQFLSQWLESYRASVRIRTYERYEQFIRLQLIPAIGHIQLQKLTAQHIQNMYTKLVKHLSSSTVNALHNMLHKALKDGVRWGVLARNVCDNVDVPRRAYYEIKPLDADQAKALLKAAAGDILEALWVLAITTGMRRGEILALKWQDINFEQAMLQVRRIFTRAPGSRYIESEPKTEKSKRSIMLASFTVEILRHHRVLQLETKLQAGMAWQEHDLVFCTSLGTPLNPNWMLVQFKKLLKKAELPDMRFHDLRHSIATILLSMGVHPKVVQELLGHNRIQQTVDTYSQVLPTIHKEAIGKLEDVLWG